MSSSQTAPASFTAPALPDTYYNFHHVVVNVAPVSRPIVLWNLLDFSHVNWVHRRNYDYCKVLAESPRVTLLEYGVRIFFFLGLKKSSPVLMWHEFVPPGLVRHLSRGLFGYTRVEMVCEAIQVDGKEHCRLSHHYATRLPKILLPFKRIFNWYLNAWSDRLWAEDSAMLARRQHVLEMGFKDHPVDVTPRATEGLFSAAAR